MDDFVNCKEVILNNGVRVKEITFLGKVYRFWFREIFVGKTINNTIPKSLFKEHVDYFLYANKSSDFDVSYAFGDIKSLDDYMVGDRLSFNNFCYSYDELKEKMIKFFSNNI